MNDALNFKPFDYYYGRVQSRSLASLQPHGVKPTVAEDGSKFYCDSDGEVVFAVYSTGAVVSILPDHVTALTAAGDYWLVGANGQSFRVD